MKHFGVTIKEGKLGFKLDRERYAIPNPRNSIHVFEGSIKYWADRGITLYKDPEGKFYSDEWCELHRQKCLRNFDLNMEFFSSLDHREMETELQTFLSICPEFVEVFDLNQYNEVPGYYIMVLDEYCQIYIGTTTNIKKRVQQHWTKNMYFDRLIFGTENTSKLSINCFRSLDTTRIFAYPTGNIYVLESPFIKYFSDKFLSNRLSGGLKPDQKMNLDDFLTMHRDLP